MTIYWDDWPGIVYKAKEGNLLAQGALQHLIQALHNFDHEHGGHLLDNWLEKQGYLQKSLMLVLCEHTFFPTDERPDVLRCAFCGNEVHKDNLAMWLKDGWITGVVIR